MSQILEQQPLSSVNPTPQKRGRGKRGLAEWINRFTGEITCKDNHFLGKLKPNENLLCLFSNNQLFCGWGFLTDRNSGPLNRISILFPTPAQKLFVYIEGGKILKSDICFQFRHILGSHLESSFVTMVTFLFSSLQLAGKKNPLAFPFLFCSSKGQMLLRKIQYFKNCQKQWVTQDVFVQPN